MSCQWNVSPDDQAAWKRRDRAGGGGGEGEVAG